MTDTQNTIATWSAWASDWWTYLDEKVNIYSNRREPVELLGGLMWPDATIAELDPEGCEFAVKDEANAWVEIGNWEHQLTKAHVYYVAYPISSDWEGQTIDDAPADECDFNRSEGVLIHAGNGRNVKDGSVYPPFEAFCEAKRAEGVSHGWLLSEEAYCSAEDFSAGEDPVTRDVIDVSPVNAIA